MNVLSLIPAPVRLVAIAILALSLGLGGALAGARLAAGHYRPELDRLRTEMASCSARRESAELQLQAQAAALDELQRTADLQRKAQAQALQQARQEAQQDYREALRILQESPRPGLDRCDAARLAFDAELRRERGL